MSKTKKGKGPARTKAIRSESRPQKYILGFLLLIIGLVPVGYLFYKIPKFQIEALVGKPGVTAVDIAKVENEDRATLAQSIGGLAVLFGLYVAWENLRTTQKAQQAAQESQIEALRIASQGQAIERYLRALEHLGAADENGGPKLELRLAGIYALDRIARDSESDRLPIMEVLKAYVRRNAPLGEEKGLGSETPTSSDIPVVIRILSSLIKMEEDEFDPLELIGLNLRKADLLGIDLESAVLDNSDLRGADLYEAKLNEASLANTRLEGADLKGAELYGTDLSDSKELTQNQVDVAEGDEKTKLPSGLIMPASWKRS